MDGSRLSCGIRTDEQKVLSGQNKIFDSYLGTIVVDFKIGIFEESSESEPVLERVFDCLHEWICRIERVFELQQAFVQFLDQRLGSVVSLYSLNDCAPKLAMISIPSADDLKLLHLYKLKAQALWLNGLFY